MLEQNGKIVQGEGFIIDDLTNHALEFIEEKKEEPFFVYLPYNTPHSPMQVPDRWWEKFSTKDLDMLHRDPEKERITHTKAALALVENIDWNVGRVMQKLRDLELEENTVVLYLSDNGPNGWRWNGGMKGRKGSVDEGGVRSPLIVQWKNTIPAGLHIRQIGGGIDLLPTLVDLTGSVHKPDKEIDGKSLAPLLLNKAEDWPDRMLVNQWRDRVSIRNQRFRLDNEGQLFDIDTDPGQSRNVSGQFPKVLRQMVQARQDFTDNVLVGLPKEDERPFTLGHADYRYTQMPARDAYATGQIQRSNRWPNSSFFTNWKSSQDSIVWQVDVLHEDDYQVDLYYTCAPQNVGCDIRLSIGSSEIQTTISEPFDPPFLYPEKDRDERGESFVKPFKPKRMGTIHLSEGYQKMVLTSPRIPGESAIDFRLLMFEKSD